MGKTSVSCLIQKMVFPKQSTSLIHSWEVVQCWFRKKSTLPVAPKLSLNTQILTRSDSLIFVKQYEKEALDNLAAKFCW